MLFLFNLVIGAVVTAIGGFPIGAWFIANAIFLIATLTAWSAVVFSGMRPAKPIPPSWILGGIAGLTMLVVVIPGLGLMLCVYPFFLGIWIIAGKMPANQPALLIVSFINLVFMVFWLHCAAVKYRRPDLPALNAVRGLILLFLWLLVGSGGLAIYDYVARSSMPFLMQNDMRNVQWLATLLLSIPVALITTLGTAECRLLVSQGRAPRGWSDRVSDVAIAVLAAVLTCLILATVAVSVWRDVLPPPSEDIDLMRLYITTWLHTLAAILLATLTARSVFLLFSRRLKLKNPLISAWSILLLLWSAPPVIDAIRAQVVAGAYDPLAYSWLMGCSPGGTIASVWLSLGANLVPGYALQVAILLAAHWLARSGK